VDIEWVRKLCLSFPKVTEQEVWTDSLTFKVAGKIFANSALIPAPVWLMFKASPESFAELTERGGIIPAPYLARAKWVALETKDALPRDELAALLRQSYDMVVAKLPRKTQESLLTPKSSKRNTAVKKPAAKRSTAKHHAKTKKPSR
jgi:predicted DNA-binding protein (MmcQ/YjbR family)